jgi:hypothetical protein
VEKITEETNNLKNQAVANTMYFICQSSQVEMSIDPEATTSLSTSSTKPSCEKNRAFSTVTKKALTENKRLLKLFQD